MTTQSVQAPGTEDTSRISTFSIVIQVGIVVGTLVCLSVGMMEWVISGSISRNSYSSFRAAQTLGLDELTLFRVLWYLVPVFTAAIFFALSGKWVRLAAILLLVQSIIVAAGGAGVLAVSVPVGNGPIVSVVSGVLSAVWCAVALATGKQQARNVGS